MNLTAYDIALICADAFGIKESEMFSKRRERRLSWPRHAAWHLARQHTTLSYPQIGSRFKRHHTTILSGVTNSRKQLNKFYDFDGYKAGFSRAKKRVLTLQTKGDD